MHWTWPWYMKVILFPVAIADSIKRAVKPKKEPVLKPEEQKDIPPDRTGVDNGT